MRIISGEARGTKINTIENLSTRPTLDRVKEALFSIIQNCIYEANVLDLFAGSGALGLESLSRGANKCIFCDKSYESVKIIKQNIQKTRYEDKSIVINKDYKKCLEQIKEEKFDIIFIDPPYRLNIAIDALKRILDLEILSKDAIIVIETDNEKRELEELENLEEKEELGIKIEVKEVRKYGRVKLIFLRERG